MHTRTARPNLFCFLGVNLRCWISQCLGRAVSEEPLTATSENLASAVEWEFPSCQPSRCNTADEWRLPHTHTHTHTETAYTFPNPVDSHPTHISDITVITLALRGLPPRMVVAITSREPGRVSCSRSARCF